MKRNLLLSFCLILGLSANLFAQQQIATLNHNDSITVFYGNYALRDAHEAAVAGDAITLSSGAFTACDITKNITIRGIGCDIDSVTMTIPTTIAGDFTLNTPNDSIHRLEIEAVHITNFMRYIRVDGAQFVKCYINRYVYYNGNSLTINTVFSNCIVKDVNLTRDSSSTFIGTVVFKADMTNTACVLMNSIAVLINSVRQTTAYNSIIIGNVSQYMCDASSAYYCIFIKNGSGSDMLYNDSTNTNMFVSNLSDVFKTFNSTNANDFTFDERYILKEEIATSFLGSDGTEVGIHGGVFPFDTRPSYMVVKKCNVAQKSTIDGKLSVDIEVMVEE